MLLKRCIPLYLEDLSFLIKRTGWVVTKIHAHLTFDQKPFKRNFILMNQKSRQESKSNIEKDFFKLMNNSNFGNDCRNNVDNCDFVPIFDEVGEIQITKKEKTKKKKQKRKITLIDYVQRMSEGIKLQMLKV